MFDLDSCIGFMTNRQSKKLAEAFNNRLAPFGVTRVQWIAMYYLDKYKSLSQMELADKMDIKPSTLARLVDRMERDGYVQRVKNDEDRRIFLVSLTEKGEKFWKDLLPEGENMGKVFSNNISDEDMSAFMKVLNQMVRNIE
ncbi:MarR family transcriptional regulator [Clostridium sp. CX1]|uniref:MarR family transcriptional regulator n=1 Tax=Clostridium tanneri TaxID=3037988 RepID=A0ABU4JQB7_9CLOT|nr:MULTISPECIES: MarR family transcriptional regulator [unclassified Clostridium]MCT8977684.1 MarR family transcriptional regulator [Clostridium sp. CX1]MDW8800353.1 MarR family transcriptional regulator [Clostridium sp. A1-XYC3]